MISSQLQSQVESEADTIIAAIDSVQSSHISSSVRYWQGLRTHSTIPSDGEALSPDNLNNGATGNVSWASKGFSASSTLSAYEVHEYSGPVGTGYMILQKVSETGITYLRIVDKGGGNFTLDWHEVQ